MDIRSNIERLRRFRVWHRYLGITLAALLMISALTGILLALKKDFPVLQPPTQKGESKSMEEWKSMAEIASQATRALIEAHPGQAGNTVDRMDARPSKGIVKVLFENGYWEVQVDASTGTIKSIAQRHSDWIEHLHDGSIISDGFKLVSMNVLGVGLLTMIVTGFWLWYGPKRYRKIKARQREQLIKSKADSL